MQSGVVTNDASDSSRSPAAADVDDEAAQLIAEEPRSVHSTNLPKLLEQLGASLVISGYQAGKVVVARNDGGTLNTHFRHFERPMGLAVNGSHLAVGVRTEMQFFRNMPDVAAKLPGPARHDACYVPRRRQVTGALDIHELGFDGEGMLWGINTRFSCLCRFDAENSFVPVWRPPYVSRLTPEDRCHLNGLAMVDGAPRYVTSLGHGDAKESWREHRLDGGRVVDISDGRVLAEGLCMPHSPRFHRGKLWVLESGDGAIGYLDGDRYVSVCKLPGFTRGLEFVENLAFVGLSQVRESSSVFDDLPLTKRGSERVCGVYVVDIERGEIVALLRFEAGVREVFAVHLMPWKFPELMEFDDPLVASSYMVPDETLGMFR